MYHSWKLTAVILAGVPIALGVMALLSKRMPGHVHEQKEHLAEATRIVHRAISSIETVKCLNGQPFELRNFTKAVMAAGAAYRAQANNQALQMGVIQFITFAMFMQGFWYGGYLVSQSQSTAGDVMTTFWSCLMATQSFQMIVPQLLALEKGRMAGAKLKAIISTIQRDGWANEEGSQGAKLKSAESGGEIKLENVFGWISVMFVVLGKLI